MNKKELHIFAAISVVIMGGLFVSRLSGTNQIRQQNAQLEYLKAHEEEIVEFVKSQSPNIETVQIDWESFDLGKIGNGLPQGGGN